MHLSGSTPEALTNKRHEPRWRLGLAQIASPTRGYEPRPSEVHRQHSVTVDICHDPLNRRDLCDGAASYICIDYGGPSVPCIGPPGTGTRATIAIMDPVSIEVVVVAVWREWRRRSRSLEGNTAVLRNNKNHHWNDGGSK